MKVTPDQIIEAARLATESYFLGENKTRRTIRNDMTYLRALVRDYDAQQETQRITKEMA